MRTIQPYCVTFPEDEGAHWGPGELVYAYSRRDATGQALRANGLTRRDTLIECWQPERWLGALPDCPRGVYADPEMRRTAGFREEGESTCNGCDLAANGLDEHEVCWWCDLCPDCADTEEVMCAECGHGGSKP